MVPINILRLSNFSIIFYIKGVSMKQIFWIWFIQAAAAHAADTRMRNFFVQVIVTVELEHIYFRFLELIMDIGRNC